MSEHDTDDGDDAIPAKPPRAPAEQVADVLGLMNRFLSKLFAIPVIHAEDIGMVEWLSLRQIAASPGLRARKLANTLSVTRQRANQIIKALRTAELITTATAEGSKTMDLTATAAGLAKIKRVDDVLSGLLGDKLTSRGGAAEPMRRRLSALLRSLPKDGVESADPLPTSS